MNRDLAKSFRLGYWPAVNAICHDAYSQSGLILNVVGGFGGIDPVRLNQILQQMYSDYPALRHEVVSIDGVYALGPLPVSELPVLELRTALLEDIFREGECYLSEGLSGGVFRLALLESEAPSNRYALMSLCHHSVSDAASGFSFLHDLLRRYSGLLPLNCESDEEAEAESVVHSLREETIADRQFGAVADGIREWTFDTPAALEDREIRWKPITLQADALSLLLQACREHGMSLGNLLSAVIIEAAGIEGNVRFATAVGLRHRLVPEISDTAFGCYMGILNGTLLASGDIWETAESAAVSQLSGIEKILPESYNEKMIARFMDAQLLGAFEKGTFSSGACLSNVGRVAMPDRIGGLSVDELHFTTRQLAGLYSAFVTALSHDGKLNMSLSYTYPLIEDAHAEKLIGRMVEILSSCMSEG